MKKRGQLFFVFSLIIISSCKKDGPAYEAPVAAKPRPIAATIGANRYYYYPQWVKYSGDTLSFFAIDTITQNPSCYGYQSVSLSFKVKSTGSIILFYNSAGFETHGYCSPNSLVYSTDSIHTGSVNVTMLDTINHLASGAFSFIAQQQFPERYGPIDTLTNGVFTNLKW